MLYPVRFQLGMGKSIFNKAEKNGVKLELNLASGIVFGLLKPYIIKYQYPNTNDVKKEAYNSLVHNDYNQIIGSAGPLYGWENLKIRPGLNGRFSLIAEFGENRKFKTMLETGFLLEVYSKKIELIEGSNQDWFFRSVFAVLYFGKNRNY